MKTLKVSWTEFHSAEVLADDDTQQEVEAIVAFKIANKTPTLVAYDDVKIEKEVPREP